MVLHSVKILNATESRLWVQTGGADGLVQMEGEGISAKRIISSSDVGGARRLEI